MFYKNQGHNAFW